MEDIFASLKDGYRFSNVILRDAYFHVPEDKQSKQVAVLNTNKGLFSYTHLRYRIASVSPLFQRKMEVVLLDISGTQVSLDGMLVAEGRND